MSSRQRNLLEAFKDAGEALPAGSPSAGGPFAGPRKVEEDRSRPPDPLGDVDTNVPKATWDEVFGELPSWLPKTVALGGMLLIGILIGRASVGDSVEAAPGAGDTDSIAALLPVGDLADGKRAEGAPSRLLPKDLGDQFSELRPLYDPANIYTVVLISYPNSEAGIEKAWWTYDWLQDLSYPVFQPVEDDSSNAKYVVLLAGAAAERAHLDEQLAQIRRQKDSSGKRKPFESAYIDKIESHLDLWRD